MSDVLTREDVIRETDYMQSFDADHLGLLGASNLLRNHDAALRARVVELEEEVGRLREDKRILVESETEEHDRAEKAEARETGLKAALNMMDECCWQAWKAFTEEGPNAAEKFLHDVCITEGIMNDDGGRIPRAALAATAKGKGDGK